ncbi:unnamed protein product [Vicia faba]|uniref:Formin-like protein n=1 Tax=Vicia faba TaxID=3906 RepID=A0AAV1B4D1_VICFA|nr:unnamed protein product [Vicia faba]
MGIQKYMVVIKFSFCVLLVFHLVAAVSFVVKKDTQDGFDRELFDSVSGLFDDEHTAKVLRTRCCEDFIHLKEEVGYRDLCLPLEFYASTNKLSPTIQPFAQTEIQKLHGAFHPHTKENFLHCLRKNNLQLSVLREEDDSKIRHVTNTGYLFSILRRNSGRVLLQHISEPPSSGPAAGSPEPSLTPSPEPSLTQSPGPSLSPSPAPMPLLPQPPSPPSSPSPFFPRLTPPDASDISAPPSPDTDGAEDKSSKKRTVVLSVVITLSVIFIAAALFFLCFRKNARLRRNDERPLLSLSMNDYSFGPSDHTFGNPTKGEKHGFQSSSNNLVDNKKTSLQENQSIGALSTAGSPFELKPPPGRVGTVHSGMPPLRPPPGRMNPLPPEPPSFRPSSNTNVAAAAAPPPPQQSGVGNARPPAAPSPPQSTLSGVAPGPPRPPLPPGPPGSTRPPPSPAPPGATRPPPSPAPPGAKPGPPPPPPPAPLGAKPGSRPPPPPPPKSGVAPPRPPIGPKASGPKASLNSEAAGADSSKAKLKPFFWDKVSANSDQSMVWNEIKSGSFQFNEEMIESLFGYNAVNKNNGQRQKESSSSQDPSPQYIQIVDKKRAQNLLILLRALNVTMEEVCDALYEGNELPPEFLQTLLKMAPTSDEELKLRLFSGDLSQLGPADSFLKALVDIPFAFKRMETLLFKGTFKEELTTTKESFAVLEVACKELRNSRLFLKLLEAVLKTGNRMNDGTYRGGAQAFKLDTLLKLSDVKGTDGKTTLLHFVVQEIIRSEGIKAARAAKESQGLSSIKTDELLEDNPRETEEDHYRELGLEVVSHLSSELENVKRGSVLDADSLTATAAKLGHGLLKAKELLNKNLKNVEDDRGFRETLESFVQDAEADVMKLLEDEKKITALVKSTGDYFHGNAAKDDGLRLFVVVRDFLIMLDKVCKEVRDAQKKPAKPQKQETTSRGLSPPDTRPLPSDYRQRLFPAIAERRIDDLSSDDESP